MFKRLAPLSLSTSLLLFTAYPVHAQVYGPQDPYFAQQVSTSPIDPPQPNTKRSNIRFFIGPALELGNRNLTVQRVQTTNNSTNPADTTASSYTTSASASKTITNSTLDNGLGVMYGLNGTWWSAGRFGLDFNLFGTYIFANQSVNILNLNGQDPSTYKNSTSTTGNEKTDTTMTDQTTITPNVNGVKTYGVSIGIPAAGAPGGTLTTTFSGFDEGQADQFVLNQGDTATNNPKNSYSSVGGVNYAMSHSVWMNDFGVNGDYALVDTPTGGVTFFGGLVMPTGTLHEAFSAKSVGDKGQGDSAVQTDTIYPDTGTTNYYTRTTSWKANDSYATDTSLLMAGPIVGIKASYQLGGLRLYSKVGYAPVLGGTAVTNSSTTRFFQSTEVISGINGTPGVQAGTITKSNGSTIPSNVSTVNNFGGNEMVGALGLGFQWSGLNFTAEGTVHSYNFGGNPELIYGPALGFTYVF